MKRKQTAAAEPVTEQRRPAATNTASSSSRTETEGTRLTGGPASLADSLNNSPRMLTQRAQHDVVQRVVRFKGVDYHNAKDLWGGEAYAYAKLKGISMADVNPLVRETDKIYDLENGLALVDEALDASPEQLEIAEGRAATTEGELEKNTEPYENTKTYDVAIDEGAAFLKGGPIELLGTSGLNGCVAVMIECVNKGTTAYFLAHVSSHLAGQQDLVQAEVNKILYTLKEAVGEELEWSDFDGGADTQSKIMLARSPSESQELFINLQSVLAKSGAKMLAALHTNVTLDFSGDEARFIGNDAPRWGVKAPTLSRDNAAIKEHGYGKSHDDSEYIESLNRSGKEDAAEAEILRIEAAAELMGLSPEERAHEERYQQYAREVGDV